MRWWLFNRERKAPHPDGSENGGAAERARAEARERLQNVQHVKKEVDKVVRESEELRQRVRDSFAQGLRDSYRRAT